METNRLSDFRHTRRVRAFNRTIQVLLGVSLLLALNFLASKHFKRFDLTPSGQYTLSAETKAYLRGLEEPIDIIVTIPEDPDVKELKQLHGNLQPLLREYEATRTETGEPIANVEYVDIYRQRKRAQELANTYNLTEENIILVASGDRTREIRQGDLFEVKDGEIRGFRGEKAITSAITNVASAETPTIYFLVGHGEMRLEDTSPLRGLSQLTNFLQKRNYTLDALDLTMDDKIPENADLIVVPSPQAALLPEEVEQLRRYMRERNGRMIVLLDPGRRHGMDELFYDWGVLAEDRAVVDNDPDYRTQGGDFIIRRFAEHPITELLIEYQITALFGQPRPVRTDPASLDDERLQVKQLIGTSEESWAERDYRTQSPPQFDKNRDYRGPVSIATVSTRSTGSELGINIPGGRMVVFGNSDFISNNRLNSFGNQTLFANSLNWALDRTNLLNIQSRPLERYEIVASDDELRRMLIYFGGVPAIIALAGFFVYLIRSR
ncbi:MAG: GldG family protein [Opitutales bacterium]